MVRSMQIKYKTRNTIVCVELRAGSIKRSAFWSEHRRRFTESDYSFL